MSTIWNIFLLVTLVQIIPGDGANCIDINDFYKCNETNINCGFETNRFISRSEWIAQSPSYELTNLTLPVHRIIIAHTATESCDTQPQCTFRTRFIQTFHIESRGLDDIGYNFLIGGDGNIYIGRGWDKMAAATKGYNVDSICIAFIGTFNSIQPPQKQLNAAKLLIREGLKLGKLAYDHKLYGQKQLIATTSPGQELYKIIQQWPNFVSPLDTALQSENLCNTSINEDSSFHLISRQNWLAQPVSFELANLQHPVKYVVISQTATSDCDTQADCVFRVRSIQTFHMEARSYDDISYNFLIGGDGSVYEGRGWDKVGIHTRGLNLNSIGIAFIGTFNEVTPTNKQLRAAELLIEQGVTLGKLNSDYILKGQRQFVATESPGLALFKIIKNWPHFCDEHDNCNAQNETLKYVSRSEWNAEDPQKLLSNLTLPVQRVIIAHTATRTCASQAECSSLIKSIQYYHMETRKWDDIAYNFLISEDGSIYEGRGWNKVGAHTRGYNNQSICIAFIGNFSTIEPTKQQLNAAQLLIEEGEKLGKLNANYQLYGQKQFVATESPGRVLYEIISTWPHFSKVLGVDESTIA